MEAKDLIGLADELALEFVNTTAEQAGMKLELIGHGRGYLDWLETVGMIDAAERVEIQAAFSPSQLDEAAREAMALREWLREVVREWARVGVASLTEATITRLNELMAHESHFAQISNFDTGPQVSQRSRWHDPLQLVALPAHAAAVLLTTGESGLVRQCEGCTVWFYDRTKGHRRRWCSMALCGNRAKARSLRERRRTSEP